MDGDGRGGQPWRRSRPISSEEYEEGDLAASHPYVVVQHLSAADDSVDCDRPNRLGDLAEE